MRKLIYLLAFISINVFSQDSVVDCFGTPSPANWIGDGFCDDGSYTWNGNPIDFNCEEFDYDSGDCPIPIDESMVYGCTDPNAVNYNPLAEIDNDSCANVDCADGEAKMLFEVTLDQYPSETGWILTDISNGQPVASVMPGEYSYDQANTTIPYQLCVPETGVELILSDTYGDGMAGSQWGGTDGHFVILADLEPCGNPDIIWELPDPAFGSAAYSGPIWLEHCDIPIEYGCTDSDYIEFNPNAQVDDGSCETEHIVGCINWTSYNYNPEATLNHIVPVCEYRLVIEDDAADGWGDSHIAVTQGDSLIGVYSMEPGKYDTVFFINLRTDIPVQIRYFETGPPQVPQEELEFQTMHNSFFLFNENVDLLISGGAVPFANNGAGALQPFEPPFWHVYDAMPYCGDYCIPTVEGCMDQNAFNYNPEANTDIGNCIPIIEGCTNELAFNYDSLANVDNNSCEPHIYGCMDAEAWNYNSESNVNDDNCIYLGCTDIQACNYDNNSNVDNGGCLYPDEYYEDCNGNCLNDDDNDGICNEIEIIGCTNPLAINFMPEATDNSGDCTLYIYGCTNEAMFNYNPIANTDDESCIPIVEGCTDPSMFNFNINANVDDGSCVPVIIGCMDPVMYNYNDEANTESNNCIPFIFGCTDTTAFNYDPLSNSDNNSCLDYIYGCINPQSLNYNPDANTDNGSCINIIYGCTDDTMYNYNPLSNTDNGTCIEFIYGCDDPAALNYNAEANTDDNTCILPIYGCMDSTAFNYDVLANSDNESCIEVVYGCTDPAAFNYNVEANTEDFSCIDVVLGCTNPESFNYDVLANTDNDACIDVIEGCMDQLAHNYNEFANTEDNSCLYDAGCIGGPGEPYWLNDTCYAWVIMVDPYCCNNEWDDKCQELYWSCSTDSDLDIEDLLQTNTLVIHPNPIENILNIVSKEGIEVKLFDVIGNLIITTTENQIDMSNLSSGTYIINIKYRDEIINKKVIKQ